MAFSLLAIAPLGYVGFEIYNANFHTVISGEAYRSGQMSTGQLAQAIQKYGIKSVLNLRGENPTSDWHQAEIATTAKLNVVHYDCSLGSGTPLSMNQMDAIVTLLRDAPKPILIHCFGGADRSGLVSALYCFTVAGKTPAVAHQELSIWYGHLPLIRPKVLAMEDSFWRYARNHAAQVGPNLQSRPISP